MESMQTEPVYAVAYVYGAPSNPDLFGTVEFEQTPQGVLVTAKLQGLPQTQGACASDIFAFHIHTGAACTGNDADPFAQAGTHYNPGGCPHPAHAGDLPPLFGCRGSAYCTFLTCRFTVREILGKTVIVHAMPDDFTTQPAGNAGKKIGCGEIRRR